GNENSAGQRARPERASGNENSTGQRARPERASGNENSTGQRVRPERGPGCEDRTGVWGVRARTPVGGDVTACSATSANATPLVHPNPSCVGYSPPPARRRKSTTSYFSVILPVALYVRRLSASQRSRARAARSPRP